MNPSLQDVVSKENFRTDIKAYLMATESTGKTPLVRIQLLGEFRVSVGDRVIAHAEWRRRKATSLIKLLALAHGHRIHREQAMDILWPDLDVEAAANNLHQVLYIVRRILDPTSDHAKHYLQLRNEILSLCPEQSLWVDVDAFETAAAEAHRSQLLATYQTALDLYTGDLLPEDRFEDWASNRRAKLQQEYLELLLASARCLANQHQHTSAIQTLQQVLTVDPAHEEAHADLMRLYALTGQRRQALRQYQLLKESLWQELAVEPEPHHQQLYEDILAERCTADAEKQGSRRKDEYIGPVSPRPSAPLHNLHIQLTRFIGREQQKAEIKQLQANARLLNLSGPGGSGKTRLALEVAADLYAADAYRDGVWLVELASLDGGGAGGALVPQAVASVLGVREMPGQPLMETLVTYLQSKQLLLVLDNCEHLIAACAQLADNLLRACPALRLLATSREPLHIPGELTWPVPSLSLPDPQQLPPLEALLQFESVQLFVDRATSVLPTFSVNQYNAPEIAQICHRLDGLPLAIELAAARVRLLTVAQINARLEDRFRLLVGGSRLALSRQQTLKATLDWSYELLSEPERVLLRRLAIFHGGFTLEAAEEICAGNELDSLDVLDGLSQLVDKSLVAVREEGQKRRYSLLETVRQYGGQKLKTSGEEWWVCQQHRDWFLALAQQAEPELFKGQQAAWFDRLETEHDNLRAALAWSMAEESERWTGLRLARALYWFFYLGSHLSEGRSWFECALAEIDIGQNTWMRATALWGGGVVAMYQGDLNKARGYLKESVSIWRALNNQSELAMALFGLGTVAINQGDEAEARLLFEECLPLFRELDQEMFAALTMMNLGDVALGHGDWASARTYYERSLALQRETGHKWAAAQALNNLGEAARYEGDYERAAVHYEESLALFREEGSSGDIARSFHNLGYVALAQGDDNRAATHFAESLALFRERGSKRGIVECVAGLASVAAARADFRLAARLLGMVEAQFETMEAAMWPADRVEFQRNKAVAQTALDEDDFATVWADGRVTTVEQAIELSDISELGKVKIRSK